MKYSFTPKTLCKFRNRPDAICRKRQRCPQCGGPTQFPYWSPHVNKGTCLWICQSCTDKSKALHAERRATYLARMKAGKERKAAERQRNKELQMRTAAAAIGGVQ